MSDIRALPDRTIVGESQPRPDHSQTMDTVSSKPGANAPSTLAISTDETHASPVISLFSSGLKAAGSLARKIPFRTRTKAGEKNNANLQRAIIPSHDSKLKDRLAQESKARVDKKNRTKAKPAQVTMRSAQSLQWEVEAANIYGDYQDQLDKLCRKQRSNMVKLEAEFDISVEAINDQMELLAKDKARGSVSLRDIAVRSRSLLEAWDAAFQRATDREANINHKFNTDEAGIEMYYDQAKGLFLNRCAELREMNAHTYLPAPLPKFSKLVESALNYADLPGRHDFNRPSVLTGIQLILFPTTKSGLIYLSPRPAANPKDSGEGADEGSDNDSSSDDDSNVVSKRIQRRLGHGTASAPISSTSTVNRESGATTMLNEHNL